MKNKGSGTAAKIYTAAVSILLAAGIVLGGLAFGLGWVKAAPVEETASQQGELILNEPEESGISLMSARIAPEDYAVNGVSPLAETAYTLTATITPEEATDKTVDWSVTWVNSEAAWVNGKTVTDYVTVTPAEDGSLTATAQCLQGFGEQIKITVTSRDNPAAYAECVCDYAQKIQDISLMLGAPGDLYHTLTPQSMGNYVTNDFTTSGNYSWTVNIDWGSSYDTNYTVTDQDSLTITLTPRANVGIVSGLGFSSRVNWKTLAAIDKEAEIPIGFSSLGYVYTFKDSTALFDFRDAISAGKNTVFYLDLKITGEYTSYTAIYAIALTPEAYGIAVQDVGISDSNLLY